MSQEAEQEEQRQIDIIKARKMQSSYMVATAVVKLTKLCMPKCMTFGQIQVSPQEEQCMESCVKRMYETHHRTFSFFKEFEDKKEKTKMEMEELREM